MDLEALAARGEADSERVDAAEVPTITAGQRRVEVLRFLSGPKAVGLSNHEVARRVGMSPTTIGDLRRRRAEMVSVEE